MLTGGDQYKRCSELSVPAMSSEPPSAAEQPGNDAQLSKADKARLYRLKLKASLDSAQLEQSRKKNRCAPCSKDLPLLGSWVEELECFAGFLGAKRGPRRAGRPAHRPGPGEQDVAEMVWG